MMNSLQSNGATSTNPQDPAVSQSMRSQMQNQVRQPSIPICNQSDVRQQLLSQNIQNNIASSGLPNSSGLTSALSHVGGMPQGTVPNVPGTNPSMHNTSNVNPNAVEDSLGQGVPSNIYANSKRQIPASLYSSSQTSNVSGGDWQEEIYQKIKSMNEMYFPELNEMYQRVAAKLQQCFCKLKSKTFDPVTKEKIATADKMIVGIQDSAQKNVSLLQQGLLAQPHTHAMQQPQQQQPQVSQIHMNDGQMNSQMLQ